MLELKKISKKFGNKQVLRDISLKINKNDCIGIIGPSGCGKSTLLRCMNSLETITEGEIYFENELISESYDLDYLRRNIGMVFQQYNLFSNMTVLENIILAPTKLKIMSEVEAIKKAKKLLKEIGLEKKINDYPHELSGGQKQRVAIVRSLIMNPKIILFDEPTSALDPEMVNEVVELMKKIKEKNITIVVVSHDINFLKKFIDKIIFIENGKIIEFGNVDEILKKGKNEKIKKFLKLAK